MKASHAGQSEKIRSKSNRKVVTYAMEPHVKPTRR